jgi:hypothetical protein
MFCEDNPQMKIGLTKFKELRPEHVLSSMKTPHNVCVCQIHENLRCCLKSLNSSHQMVSAIITDYKIHENFTCPQPTINCFDNRCVDCMNCKKLKETAENLENLNQPVSWNKWVKTTQETSYCNIEKLRKTGTIEQLLEEIYEQVPEFLLHQYIKLNQEQSSAEMSKRASEESSIEAVICCDFGEKFKCIDQNAPQSAHYGQKPVSIFTVAVYHRKVSPMVIVSDCEKKTKESVLAYLDCVLSSLPDTARTVHFWSDNATSQFKNMYVMEAIKTFEEKFSLKIWWHFYAPMHGKSVVDGIGGSVKRFVRRKILSKEVLVHGSDDFAEVAKEMNVEIKLVNEPQIDLINKNIRFKDIVKNASKIPNIKKLHSFEIQQKSKGKKEVKTVVASRISKLV